jgi:hypothetical protein
MKANLILLTVFVIVSINTVAQTIEKPNADSLLNEAAKSFKDSTTSTLNLNSFDDLNRSPKLFSFAEPSDKKSLPQFKSFHPNRAERQHRPFDNMPIFSPEMSCRMPILKPDSSLRYFLLLKTAK